MRYKITTILCFLFIASIVLVGCTTPQDPVIKTVTVEKAVPVKCTVTLGDRPDLQTRDVLAKALAAAPSFDDRMKIVTEQLLLYMGWTPKVEAALSGCSNVPNSPAP